MQLDAVNWIQMGMCREGSQEETYRAFVLKKKEEDWMPLADFRI